MWQLDGPDSVVRVGARAAGGSVPAVSALQAWLVVEGAPGWVATATWELEAGGAPDAAAALAARAGRCPRVGEQILSLGAPDVPDAEGLLLFAMEPPPHVEDEFNAWYDTEHCPRLAAVPGALTARRYRVAGDEHPRYLALYHLRDPRVCAGPEWSAAADTPWTARMRALTRRRQRLLCRRVPWPSAACAANAHPEEAHA